ncbi:GTP-binding protein [Caldanaerobacter subterraneus subsp. tengcongensis MB4]|uniref:Large ribosomal subunit assembly factor BipA n=1 Tax=Caldanaerobacter subterraneus subsp. tengcongensis (strain DSM 15242 / JCM 11007 / NBRC 100824 / MB4) TaxID=273068 RepID=Q8RBE0_CALS4|nr:translational GTPase TypA [Caldanaerobacter subterraneus]AAM24138.1 predicted membrane GTPase involved in stress response [Caldanaerobacter subterraneus subsp. tengcongensis MB4]MBE3579847.1 translational GTPase TypA [Caldanaerobacter subterraneus]MCS3916336.1 GTP-binding protein [Caldanaerobacter subterraneus subsp. tengcongensis MB4]
MRAVREDVRNVAIIAHVDHGKTTLVDAMLKQSGIFRWNEKVEERILDFNDLERERGITILAKNTAVRYKNVKINIVDTPGHADFSGEVERVLKMVDGVLLLVDSFEGPMPQTRFVLSKALELDLKPIVVISKIDRPDARPNEVIDEVFDLFIELGANDDQIDFPVVYTSGKGGIAKLDLKEESRDLRPLFETIIKYIPAPSGDIEGPFQLIVTTLDYDDYIGRIAIGKVVRGRIKAGEEVAICKKGGSIQKFNINNIYQFEGLRRVPVEEAKLGDIVAVSGIRDIEIGETIADKDNPEPVDFVEIEEPTVSMTFSVNTSPFAGTEGKYVTSRHLRERLFKELETNVALRVEETDSPDSFKVSGRGELHLSILIETMRREGYELQVSKPTVIFKEVNGVKMEPIELLTVDIPEEYMGVVMEKLGPRKAELMDMHTLKPGTIRLKFKIPTRGLIGYRSEFLTDTKGNGIMTSVFYGYEPYKGEIPSRSRGALVAFETGIATTYGLYHAQERGTLFIEPGTKVYEGMVVGMNSRSGDIEVNVCKKKHVTNLRSATAEEALRLSPVKKMTLEEALEFIDNDELVEVTPQSIRIRKKILDSQQRYKSAKQK